MSAEETVGRPVPPTAQLVWIEDAEAQTRVEGWLFPVDSETAAPAIIFFHGNNEVIDHCLEFPETYARHGIATLLVEYRGYGRSTGNPGREAIRADMIRFYDWLVQQPGIDPERIVFQGRSIGGAVAADLTEHRAPVALMLSSTFTTMEGMYWRFGVPGFIAADKYRTADVLAEADFPVLVMHGERDNIIPISHGRKLGTLGNETTYIEYDANHDLPVHWPTYEADLLNFLKAHGIL